MECFTVFRKKGLQVQPEFKRDKIIFHPIPRSFESKVKEGEIWCGEFGALHETGKKDVYGRPIYYQYFIPKNREISYDFEAIVPTGGVPKVEVIKKSGKAILGRIFLTEPSYVDYYMYFNGSIDMRVYYDVSNYVHKAKYGLMIEKDGRVYYYIPFLIEGEKVLYEGEPVNITLPGDMEQLLVKLKKQSKEAIMKYNKKRMNEEKIEKEQYLQWLSTLRNKAINYCETHRNPPPPKHINYWYMVTGGESPIGGIVCYYRPEDIPYVKKSMRYFDAIEKILGLRPGEYSARILEMAEDNVGDEIGEMTRKFVNFMDDVIKNCTWKIVYKGYNKTPPNSAVRGECPSEVEYIVDWR